MKSGNWNGGVVPNGSPREWAEYHFKEPRRIASVDIYWLDDGGGVRVPRKWRLLYRQAGKWTAVKGAKQYGVAKDQWNTIAFGELETDALRLEVDPQTNCSCGILEWRVNP